VLVCAAALAAVGCGGAARPTEAPTVLPTMAPTAITIATRQPALTADQVKANLATSLYHDRVHMQKGLDCTACHKQAAFDTIPKKETCLTCHGPSYADLATKTATQTPNPHKSHLNDEECSSCHGVHRPFVFVCQSCHSDNVYKGRFATK
jgi:fumarate reductase flavoprotein subunit